MSARFPAAVVEVSFWWGPQCGCFSVLLVSFAFSVSFARQNSPPAKAVEFFFAKAEVVSEFVEDGDFNFVG